MREELPTARLRLGQVLMIGCLASLAPACGDGPICASDVFVFITTPDNGDAMFSDEPFLQTQVTVRTSLRATEQVELRVIDEFGREFFLATQPVDATGTARVSALLPVGRSSIQARGITEQCGTGDDFIEVEVTGSATSDCFLDVLQPPASDPDFAPLSVYNADYDQNSLVDGLQTSFDVYANPGFQVDLMVIDLATGAQTSAGTRLVDGFGAASYTMTIPEGPQELIAYCTSPDGTLALASNPLQVHVDTLPPECVLDSPVYGEDITADMDQDGDLTNGLQLELVGTVRDTGAEDFLVPPPLFVVEDVRFQGTTPGEEGTSSVVVTLDEETLYFMGIEAEDQAGNTCLDVRDYWYVGGSVITVEAVNRSSVRLSWLAPGLDGSGLPFVEYELRVGPEPFDELNFDFVGERYEIPPPGAPGQRERVDVEGLTPGTTVYAALVARNEFGGPRFIGAVGPLELDFDATPAIAPVAPNDGENGLGYQSAAGDFNADGYNDVAVSAPFKSVNGLGGAGAVYVYFGDATGPNTTPGMTIEGDTAGGQLGNGLTAMDWNDDGIVDLIVGAPFTDDGQGKVLVYLGDASFGGARNAANADVHISASNEPGNWFQPTEIDGFEVGVGLGFSLTRARFDEDQLHDLVISVPGGGGGNGGVVVLYGERSPASNRIVLNSLRADDGAAVAVVLQDPDPGSIFGSDPGAFFGQYVFPLGRTEGAADDDDDIGVAYTEKNAAVVFRGRPRPASPGVTLLTFDPARDLEIQRTSSDDRSSRFGNAMGSIADINNDGVREIVVGIWRDLANIGRVEIYRGNAVGVRSASTIRLRSITPGAELCGASGCGLGSAIVNNAAGLFDPDVNGDGLEDLVVIGGMDAGRVQLMVWFGGSLPATDFTSTSANYVVSAPAEFVAGARGDSDATPITALWVGDINGDELEDICWADWSAQGRDGVFQLLYDDRF